MLRLAFDFIITWRETRTRPNAYLSILGFLLSLFVACWNMKIKDRHYSRLSRDVMWRLTGKIFVMEALL